MLQLTPADQIKAEIWKRGPVGCALHVTPAFYRYQEGIFSEVTPLEEPNHELSVVGWGVTNGTECVS